ncbi:hypothetical protein PV325_003931 [Microctonus aethiopoides]|nr:hypothetical protein PV325_003931 [Microctonus aethiopoides]KAK0078283.1 hypothetical protein PV326_009462 [Microctonus aethiopoides]
MEIDDRVVGTTSTRSRFALNYPTESNRLHNYRDVAANATKINPYVVGYSVGGGSRSSRSIIEVCEVQGNVWYRAQQTLS